MPELSPNANAYVFCRSSRVSVSHAANYFVVLLGGLSRADSGLIVMQTSETDEEGGIDYLLKPIIKIEDFCLPTADGVYQRPNSEHISTSAQLDCNHY